MNRNKRRKIDLITLNIFALIVSAILAWAFPLVASDFLEGRILEIHQDSGTVTLLDFFDGTKKEIVLEDTKGIKKNSIVRLWLLDKQDATLKAQKIEPVERSDSTGMKRRLRKALGAMKRHGSKGYGHRGRCGR